MAAPDVPKTTAGIIIEKTGGTEVLQYRTDLPVPAPKDAEVLVKNEFVGINFIDTYFRTGLYPAPRFPYTLGREGAGTVLAAGPASPFRAGDRVAYLAEGAYAGVTLAASARCVKVPAEVSLEDAAAGLLQGLTAWTLIRDAHETKEGQWTLVQAAAGGVGLWLVQMLKSVGARVVATCSSSKVELVRSVGADVVVDYTKDDYVAAVMQATGGAGVAAVFDGVGKTTFDKSLECVARKGSMVSFGNASGAVPPFAISRLSAKNVKLTRPTLLNYLVTPEEVEENTTALFNFMIKGHIKVRIHEIYPLQDVARAHQDLEGRKTTGKLLLKV